MSIIVADAIAGLKQIDAGTAYTCVTSPPYYGLRDYGVAGQIGLEKTPEEYIQRLVDVFREVRRVLRDDGTLFVNIGDTYSSGVTNAMNFLHASLKECLVFGFDSFPVAQTAKGVNVSPLDEWLEDGKLAGLLGTQREGIKDRNDDLLHVFDFLTIPRNRRGCCTKSAMARNNPATDVSLDVVNGSGIIVSDLDSDLQAELTILFPSATRAGEKNDATFTIEKSRKPGAKSRIRWHSCWESFYAVALDKRVPDVNLVDDPVSFGNCLLPFACDFRDFVITKASDKQITFSGVDGGVSLAVNAVRHLRFVLSDGSVVPYTTLYNNAIKKANKYSAKNELMIPFRLADALQEDGWICRQTIIWSKPNPMPESVTDRCTKSHEYIFLLSKSPHYYYDAEAIKEPIAETTAVRMNQDIEHQSGSRRAYGGTDKPMKAVLPPRYGGNKYTATPEVFNRTKSGSAYNYQPLRNKRDVWTVSTKGFKGAHFAVFPEELIRPCVLAGCPAGGTVLDPFMGSGTTAIVAIENNRNYLGCEINPKYVKIIEARIAKTGYQTNLGDYAEQDAQ